ncbi:MAG: hypothetical protein ACE5JX_22940 [Acidobacteriota bacterium]
MDLDNNGFRLTDADSGVDFDLDTDGSLEHTAWTALGSDDAFLALDRDRNGRIDDGAELFGDSTPQPPSASRNGFLALAVYDRPELGGDGDGSITPADLIFPRLKLWRDLNHDGLSQPDELHSLSSYDIVLLDLDYRESRYKDQYGNEFRYRARVASNNKPQRNAFDVFFLAIPWSSDRVRKCR